jgi:hypothetical protein
MPRKVQLGKPVKDCTQYAFKHYRECELVKKKDG